MGESALRDKILLESYEQVGGKILSDVDFSMANLKSSLSLFTDDSIRQRKPVLGTSKWSLFCLVFHFQLIYKNI